MTVYDFNQDEFLLSVVIPVYNEAGTISEILDRVTYAPFKKEIIVVDDGSTDGTRQILKETKNKTLKICYHENNCGKGRALQTGFQLPRGISSLCRMRIWNTTQTNLRSCSNRSCPERPMSFMVHGYQAMENTASFIFGTMSETAFLRYFQIFLPTSI